MIQLANYEARTFYVMLGKVVTSVDVTFTFQMTEQTFTATLVPVSSTLRATKFTFTATGYPEGQYQVQFVETGQTTVLAQIAGFVTGNPIFATSQYNTYNDDGTSTTYVPSDDQGLVPSVSQKLRVSTVNQTTDVSYVRYIKVTNGTLTDNGDNSVTIDTGGGGAESLNDLSDVTIVAPLATGQTLIYDHSASPRGFYNQKNLLSNLGDTNITSTPANSFLQYVNGAWTAVPVNIPSPPPTTTDGLPEGSTNLYYTESRVSANTSVAANTAKNSYPTADATKLAGIATGATANQTDAYLLSRANHTGTQLAATISDFDTEVSNNTSVVANTAKNSYPTSDATKLAGIETGADVTDETNVKAALDGMVLTDIVTPVTADRILIQDASASNEAKYVSYGGFALKSYLPDELVTNQNKTIDAGVSVATSRIVDIMADALADTSNANSKKMLGFHTGNGLCVLQGMVDAGTAISGATSGSPLWLGASGAFSATAPTTATYYSRVVGYYVDTLVGGEVLCYFNPSQDWVQID